MGRIWTNGTGLALNATNLNSLENDVSRSVKPWAANTDYTAGQAVVDPNGVLSIAAADHTSGASFSSANWTPVGIDENGNLPARAQAQLVTKATADVDVKAQIEGATQTRATLNAGFTPRTAGGIYLITLGDSLDLGSDSTITPARGSSWPTYASLALNNGFYLVRNAGIGGDTTAQMLARFDTDVAAYSPTIVTIGGGRNDITNGVALTDYKANTIALVDKVKALGARPVLRTINPTNSSADRAKTALWNNWRRQYAAQYNIPLLDFYQVLVDPATGGYKAGYAIADGVHPTPAALKAMGDCAGTQLGKILPPWTPPAPYDGGDTANLLTNGFWTTQTLTANNEPSGWLVTNPTSIASAQFTTDANGVVWLEYTFSASAADVTIGLLSGNRPTAATGSTFVASGIIDANISAGSYRVQCPARTTSPATSYPLYDMQASAKGRFWMEFPADGPVNLQVFIAAGTTGTIRLAQLSLTNKANYA
jgi:lysophospholipase L1-like esterase